MASDSPTRDSFRAYFALYKGQEMRLVIDTAKDFSQEVDELFGSLEEGKYIVNVIPIGSAKTVRDLQNQYFLLIDIVSAHSGEAKYMLHENFKRNQKVETTKNFDLQDWIDFIDAFKWKQFNDYDLIL